MEKCNYCGKEIEDGYLEYNFYVICNECVEKLYSKDELKEAYENDEIFWTTYYDDED